MSTTTELSKTYEPAAVEAAAYRVWLDEKCFAADPDAPGEPYCIVIPPPNVTGALHLGHAINATLQDILIRLHRMRGFNALWIPGVDHAGIATQAVVEKQLKEKENKTRHDVGRDALVQRIWDWKAQYGDRIVEQLKRIGASCDWDRLRFTLDDQCATAVRETFFKLFKDGLIYRGKRLVNWDVHLQTSISDDEIYHETVKTFLWHIKYPIVLEDGPAHVTIAEPLLGQVHDDAHGAVMDSFASDPDSRLEFSTDDAHPENTPKDRPTHMTVATTRPETMLGDTAVAVHSQDPRWNWAIGKRVRLPLTGRLIPIIADDILVDPKFGSGVVKVTPAHDPNDYAVWQRHQGEADAIEIINILNPDGTLNENAGEYKGLSTTAGRKKVVEDLTARGLLAKEEPYETQVGHSDRSKTAIQPYLSDQWFVKMAPLAEPALDVVRRGLVQFFPERHAQQYLSWLGEKRDWPVSRQLWWGHRIPVWRYDGHFQYQGEGWAKASKDALIDSLNDWIASNAIAVIPNVEAARRLIFGESAGEDVFICIRENVADRPEIFASTRGDGFTLTKYIESIGFVQDPDVLDTWFSSALWPHSTLGWPSESAELKKWYPTSVLLTGRDIITLWVARMVMAGLYNMAQKPGPANPHEEYFKGRGMANTENFNDWDRAADFTMPTVTAHHTPAAGIKGDGDNISADLGRQLGVPFRHVVINPTILDGRGERMSKSKGNGVDPVDVIDTHGADALRFTLATMATETQDVRMPVKQDAQGRNTSDKFDLGRNFCNKLWNACRFALGNLEAMDRGTGFQPVSSPGKAEKHGLETSAANLSLADRWIISRFNRAVGEANKAVETYRFDQYAKACYDFVWRDFCDWYLEAIKPAMKDPARAARTADVLAALIDGTLRLLHPVVPFVTETIWWRLNDVRPARGLPGKLDCVPAKRLVKAAWPIAGPTDDDAERVFARLQGIVGAIRNLRNEHKADARRVVAVCIAPPADAAGPILDNRELVEVLAGCAIKDVRPGLAPPPDAVRVTVDGCDVFVEGLVDPNAEAARVAKKRDELTKQIESLRGRLASEAYTSKAPPHLVQQTKDALEKAETELAKLG